MSDENYYLQATNEVNEGNPIPALWSKALALVGGDYEEAKYKYISLRVNQLKGEVGFVWWKIWAWIGLIIVNLSFFVTFFYGMPVISLVGITINTILMVMVLNFDKYAFLISTFITFNPIIWVINGIYLKNRWSHPDLNKCRFGHKGFCEKCGEKIRINYGDAYYTSCKRCI